MKILVFMGGLGNQIFEYAFLETYVRRKFLKHKIYGVYNKKKLSEHYGLEINKWFNVNMPPRSWWIDILTALLYFYKKIQPNTPLLDLDQRDCVHENALLFYPIKFNKRFIPNTSDWLKWNINEQNLSFINKKTLEDIRSSYSVFIHVRRGDYLSLQYKSVFEGCCTLDYYKQAIAHACSVNSNLKFFCFSDDIQWAKQNLILNEDSVYIDWNVGADSPLDMFLMSQCKAAIIANSTFSYWGARLGVSKDFICYPKRWMNTPISIVDDIIPNDWIGF